jgi:hypothetical protein
MTQLPDGFREIVYFDLHVHVWAARFEKGRFPSGCLGAECKANCDLN